MSVGPESHYHAFFFALTWFLPCIKFRKSKIFSCHILCAFLIFVFSIFIYEIEHGLSNKFILINSSWLLYVEQWKKLALSLIYTDQTNQIIKMVSKWKSNVIDVFYFMSTSEMAGREFFELQSTKQGL